MDTNDLIKALAADSRRPMLSLSTLWWRATGLAVAVSALAFFATLGVRPDIAAAAETPRLLFKFAIALVLAVSSFAVARALLRPEQAWRRWAPYLVAAPMLLAVGAVVELSVVPPDSWSLRAIGANGLACLVSIAVIGIGPLAILLLALRHGAPAKPAMAGAVAGLLAGGIAAAFYAAHCTDDSPLFVALWYTAAVAGLALLGALGANRIARW